MNRPVRIASPTPLVRAAVRALAVVVAVLGVAVPASGG